MAKLFDLLGAVGEFEFEEAVFKTDFLNATFCERCVVTGVDKFVFNGTAAAVED